MQPKTTQSCLQAATCIALHDGSSVIQVWGVSWFCADLAPDIFRGLQVFKGLKNDVQQVAIKVLNHTDAQQLAQFVKVCNQISRCPLRLGHNQTLARLCVT